MNHFFKAGRNFACVIFATAFLSPAALQAQYPFSDGFESGDFITGGWVTSGNAVISTQSPATGIYCAEGPSTWGINKTLSWPGANILTADFNVKASQTNTTCLIFRIKDVPGGTSAGIFFDDLGNINGVNGSGAGSIVVLTPYIANEWYFIRMVLDMTSQTFDIFINNNLLADDFNFYSPSFTTPSLFTWSSLAASGSCWIDNVNLTTSTTAIDEWQPGSALHVFPNPARDILNVQITENTGAGKITLNDNLGRSVWSVNITPSYSNKTLQLNFENLSPSVYTLTYSSDEKTFTRKIILQ